jgi:hypothetical protein
VVALNPSANPCRVLLPRKAAAPIATLLSRDCSLAAKSNGVELAMKGVSYGIFKIK